MNTQKMSLIMAKRLKAKGEDKKISHATLSREIKEKYNVDISRNGLMNYEVSDPYHRKAFTNTNQ